MGDKTIGIEEIQNLPEGELLEQVAVLDADQLKALRALEAADTDGGRAAVLAAIDAKLAEPPADDAKPETAAERKAREKAEAAERKAREKAEAEQSAAAAAAAAAPAWQAPDYTGPLDIAQANWRTAHIKPVREVRGK